MEEPEDGPLALTELIETYFGLQKSVDMLAEGFCPSNVIQSVKENARALEQILKRYVTLACYEPNLIKRNQIEIHTYYAQQALDKEKAAVLLYKQKIAQLEASDLTLKTRLNDAQKMLAQFGEVTTQMERHNDDINDSNTKLKEAVRQLEIEKKALEAKANQTMEQNKRDLDLILQEKDLVTEEKIKNVVGEVWNFVQDKDKQVEETENTYRRELEVKQKTEAELLRVLADANRVNHEQATQISLLQEERDLAVANLAELIGSIAAQVRPGDGSDTLLGSSSLLSALLLPSEVEDSNQQQQLMVEPTAIERDSSFRPHFQSNLARSESYNNPSTEQFIIQVANDDDTSGSVKNTRVVFGASLQGIQDKSSKTLNNNSAPERRGPDVESAKKNRDRNVVFRGQKEGQWKKEWMEKQEQAENRDLKRDRDFPERFAQNSKQSKSSNTQHIKKNNRSLQENGQKQFRNEEKQDNTLHFDDGFDFAMPPRKTFM